MEDRREAIQYEEGQELLFDSSYRAIPFNAIMATLLAIYLFYNHGPKELIVIWLAAIVVISLIRMIHCRLVVSRQLFKKSASFNLKIFVLMTLLAGLVWTSIYFVSIPYIQELQIYVIILVFGGMAAGSATTLSIYPPSFYAYIFSIFLPVTIYNYLINDFNHAILATMFLFFLLAITLVSKAHQRLLRKTFFLTEQNKILLDKFEILSITDSLTGLYNRRHFTKCMQDEYNRAKRNQQSFALVSIDVDNFKLINDNFGHPFGDNFLTYISNYLKNYLRRSNDIIFRLGGDEFAALLVNTNEQNAKGICEELKNNFLKKPSFEYAGHDSDHQRILDQISMSIGIVYVPYDSITKIDQIIEKADQSLYQSKGQGKNKIIYTKCI